MKISAALFLSAVASASAFVAPAAVKHNTMALRMSAEEPTSAEPEQPVVAMEMTSTEEPTVDDFVPKAVEADMSMSMPFMARPMALDGSMAGDVGFDPLGFAKSEQDLMNYREAEIKHSRLAMLAAAGWPLSEVFDKKIAGAFGLTPVLDASDRAPSVLNGGLDKISPAYWIGCILLAGAIDVYGISQKGKEGYFPGNLGFDPLGLYPQDEAGQLRMQTTEIKNGRLAMIAITAFAVQEAVSKLGVIDETPLFFKPITTVVSEYTNSGYIVH
ncbi:chloroplastic [Seminavis robusta]|uniref:Chloroplastic n=1 Tax=Seminavis robusta TaxID=568900 RepID=A0A9N8H762_9STRA|nr:chloroplastic [Seminavis robusta]|eukprot:Sro132_g062570.1 chloroplastic (272) ;mRNA; f:51269-52084